jgi:hypothetical protein
VKAIPSEESENHEYRQPSRFCNPRGVARIELTHQMLSNLARDAIAGFRRRGTIRKGQMFDKILGYERIKRTFLRSLKSKESVHILLVGQCISIIPV